MLIWHHLHLRCCDVRRPVSVTWVLHGHASHDKHLQLLLAMSLWNSLKSPLEIPFKHTTELRSNSLQDLRFLHPQNGLISDTLPSKVLDSLSLDSHWQQTWASRLGKLKIHKLPRVWPIRVPGFQICNLDDDNPPASQRSAGRSHTSLVYGVFCRAAKYPCHPCFLDRARSTCKSTTANSAFPIRLITNVYF